MKEFNIQPEIIELAARRLMTFDRKNGILSGNTERLRSRFLGVAAEMELYKILNGEYPHTYADVNEPDDDGKDIEVNGDVLDLKMTRADYHPNSWVFSKFQHTLRDDSSNRGYIFLRAHPSYPRSNSLLHEQGTSCLVEIVGAMTLNSVKEQAKEIRQRKDEKNVTKRVTTSMLSPWTLPV